MSMSRGWESKSVESQQQASEATNTAQIERGGNSSGDAEQKRRRQALELQRERVLSERTSSPHRRTALSNALATIEEELAELGWTIHLKVQPENTWSTLRNLTGGRSGTQNPR